MTLADVQLQDIGGHREHSVSTADGVRLNCREFGNSHAQRTVVLLHGLCLDQTTWSRQTDALLTQWGAGIRIITFDYRGHGKSQAAPVNTYTVEQIASDLSDVIRAFNVTGQLTLAGHSMGGMACLCYLGLEAHRRAIDPQGLVLAASSAGGLAERGLGRLLATPALGVLAEVVATMPHQLVHDTIRAITAPACRALTRAAGFGVSESVALSGTAAAALSRTTPAAAIGFLPSLRRHNQVAQLRRVTATTVIVSGGKDVLTPQHHADTLIAGIPHAIHLTRPEAGHMLLLEAAQIVTEAINITLRSTTTPATRDA